MLKSVINPDLSGKNLIFILILFFLILHYSIANAIEVGGHLTEDTTWSPENNPYLVTEDLFVDTNVTLTILPGTEVKIKAAPYDYPNSDDLYYVFYDHSNVAKLIWVDGKIVAEGTGENPVIFTRMQDSLYYHWGVVYLRENAGLCKFKYCNFSYSAEMIIVVGIIPMGAISIYNQDVIVDHCNFNDNLSGIVVNFSAEYLSVTNSKFYTEEGFAPLAPYGYRFGGVFIRYNQRITPILIANNKFYETISNHNLQGFGAPIYSVYNKFNHNGIYLSHTSGYIYKNELSNSPRESITGGDEGDSLYIKGNKIINASSDGIDIDHAYVEISDNYLDGCGINASMGSSGKINNNVVNQAGIEAIGELELLNNISINGFKGFAINQINSINNSIALNNDYALGGYYNDFYNNCIILNNDNLSQYGVSGNPIFRNCIIDFPLDPPLVDGGGNIIVDSLQAQQIFTDIENGDFHLTPGSIAIDAGFDTTNYYYPFDIDYHKRVWDGNGDGNAIIDIGPYEYGAPEFGKIKGHITETTTGEPVDYVLIKINDESGNFTFADSTGYFEIPLPAGNYDIYAERVFYEDKVIYGVNLSEGEDRVVYFNMRSTLPPVSVNNDELQIMNCELSNYPNPFNPTTTISFNLPSNSNVTISIYNIKGQKVKTLVKALYNKGMYKIIWDGKNDNGQTVASGVYFYKFDVNGKTKAVKKCLMLK